MLSSCRALVASRLNTHHTTYHVEISDKLGAQLLQKLFGIGVFWVALERLGDEIVTFLRVAQFEGQEC